MKELYILLAVAKSIILLPYYTLMYLTKSEMSEDELFRYTYASASASMFYLLLSLVLVSFNYNTLGLIGIFFVLVQIPSVVLHFLFYKHNIFKNHRKLR